MTRTDPWTAPRGAAPYRPTGEVGPVVGSVAHLGAGFVAANIAAAAGSLVPSHRVVAAVAFAVAAVGAVFARRFLQRSSTAVLRILSGFAAAVAAAYAGEAVGLLAWAAGASRAGAVVAGGAGALAAATIQHRRRASAATAAMVAISGTTAVLAAIAMTEDPPHEAYAAALLLVAVVLARLAMRAVVRPEQMTAFAAVAAAMAAAVVVVSDHPGAFDQLASVAVVALVCLALREAPVPVALVVVALGGAAVLSLVAAASDVDAAPAVGPAIAGALLAALAAEHERRSPLRPRLGGTYAVCGALTLIAAPFLTAAGSIAVDLLGVACLILLLVAAATVRRLVVAAGAIVELLTAAPTRLAHSAAWGRHLEELALVLAGVVIVVVAARSRRVDSPAAATGHGDLPAGPSATVVVDEPYAVVFDRILAAFLAAGDVQHVDRAAGRIASADAAVAVWQQPGEMRTHVVVYADDPTDLLLVSRAMSPTGGT